MIITKTPLRISFLGGGTDYPEHFRRYGGQTIGVAIDKYSYVSVNRLADLFDYSIRVGYSRTELVKTVEEIEHPAVRECLRFLGLDHGIEIVYAGDLPARTGLGSSSSFTVGLLHALHAFKGELTDHAQLAAEAVYVEQELIKERVGVQDQHLCAHGGLLHIQCAAGSSVRAVPLPVPSHRLAALHDHMMLFYTGIQRTAHQVLEEQVERTRDGRNSEELRQLCELVDQGIDILTSSRPIGEFGEVLHSAWMIKRRLSSKITNPEIDAWYEAGRRMGAIGGKLLGAGGGGFLLLFAAKRDQPNIERALTGLRRVAFEFDLTGTDLLFYRPV